MNSQVIPDAAVEAAIEALRTRPATLGMQTWKDISLTVLEAAAPHMVGKGAHATADVEELAEVIARRRYARNARPSVWITGRAAREVAGVILAAGYRKISK